MWLLVSGVWYNDNIHFQGYNLQVFIVWGWVIVQWVGYTAYQVQSLASYMIPQTPARMSPKYLWVWPKIILLHYAQKDESDLEIIALVKFILTKWVDDNINGWLISFFDHLLKNILYTGSERIREMKVKAFLEPMAVDGENA